MKKILSLVLSVVMLITMLCAVPVTAETGTQEEIYPTPTEVIAGPDVFKGEPQAGGTFPAYISKEKAETVYNKYLIADFNLDFSAFSNWSSVTIYLDSATSDAKNGIAFQISGPSSFASNAKGFVENPSGCGVVLKKKGTVINAAPLNATKAGVISTDYRIIIKRVIGTTDTAVEFYMFEKGTPVPAAPMFSFTYTNEEYGPAAASLAFVTWECSKFTVSDLKLFNYNISLKNEQNFSIDNPSLVPTKTVDGPIIIEGVQSTETKHEAYVSKDDVRAGTFNKILIADFKFAATTNNGWSFARLWLDSWDCTTWTGFCFDIAGTDSFKANAKDFVDNPDGVGVVLRQCNTDGKAGTTKIDAAPLNVSLEDFSRNEYRIILKRIVGATETTFEFYMFDADYQIPDEPMFKQTFANDVYGPASTSVGFTTKEPSHITLSDMKLYNYDLSIEPYLYSVDDSAIVPTKTVDGPIIIEGVQSTETKHEAYVSKDDVRAGTFNKILIADFKFAATTYYGWSYARLWLDSWDCTTWTGFCFDIVGTDSFKANATAFVDNPDGVGVVLRQCNTDGKAGTIKIDAAPLNVSLADFRQNEYRIILKRIVGATETTFEFYMFDADYQIPDEPMFKQTFANDVYGPASTSVGFTTKEPSYITLSDMKLYNYDLSIKHNAPFIGNRIEAPATPEEPEAIESTVITRTSESNERWLDTKAAPAEYDYSIAVVGDTQYINRHAPDQFPAIYDWILDNVDDKKIKFVAGLGDITEGSSATDQSDWLVAQPQINRLNGVVPFSIVRGNHDLKTYYNQYFPYENYADNLGGSFDGTMLNTWQELVVGSNKYLIMGLDYGCDDDVLEWANSVVADHPEHNVIVTTHGYLEKDGTLLDDDLTTSDGYNDGDDMWHKFVKKHSNITMVLAGHIISEDIVAVQSKGENGNIVTQMLINPQSLDHLNSSERPTGMVCMLYFSDGGSKVEVEYYSTVKNQYFKDVNQFNMELDVVAGTDIGDANGDGEVNASDLAVLRKILLRVERDYNKTVVDLNGDGALDIIDLIRFKKSIAS